MRLRSGIGSFILLLVTIGVAPLVAQPARARAGRDPRDEVPERGPDQGQGLLLERAAAHQLARLDNRLGLNTSPDGTGRWTARLAASLEYRLLDLEGDPEGPGAFAPHLMARLADDLRRLGVERDLDPPPARPGVAATPEPPGRERVARLQDILETLRRLDAKLDRLDGVEDRTARLAPRVAPANDDCVNALVITDGTVSGSTTGATHDGTATCGSSSSSPDVWYRYTAAADGVISFDTFGSSFDTVLSIHDGCPDAGRDMELACNDDARGTVQSQVSLAMTAGEEVWVRVSGFGGVSGSFDLTVSPDHGIEGTVTREDTAAALAGATVRLYGDYGYLLDTTTTGADGTYNFSGLSDGTYFILAFADGVITEIYDDFPCASFTYCDPGYDGTPITVSGGVTSGIDLALSPAGSIEGTVTDASTGDSLDGFAYLYSSTGNLLDSVFTSVDGTYSFTDLPAGKYYLSASASGYRAELYDDVPCASSCNVTTGTQVPVVIGAHVAGIDFALDHLGALSGTLTEAGTGDPIQGARVEIYNSTGSYEGSAYTNSAGTYLRQSLAADTYYVLTSTSGYSDELYDDLPCDTGCTATSGTPVAVALATTTTGIDFSLVAYGKVAGHVTEAITGLPLTGGYVDVFDTTGNGVQSATPAADGSYEIAVPPGTHFVGTASYYNHRDETWDDLPCEPGPCDRTSGTPIEVAAGETLPGIDFVLDRWGVVQGTAIGADTLNGLEGNLQILDAMGTVVASDYNYGSFTVNRLPAGTYYAKFAFDEWLNEGYQDELYDNVPCEPSCDLTRGTPFAVMLNGTVAGLDFVLARCPANTENHLVGSTYFGSGTVGACEKLTADNGTTVATGADITFKAGRSIVLGDGFKVESGASFRAVIEPSWTSDQ